MRNSKSEILNSKQFPNSNDPKSKQWFGALGFRIWNLFRIFRQRRTRRAVWRACLGFIFLGMQIDSVLLAAQANEVMEQTNTMVVVREHPRTGRPYVSITSLEAGARDPFEGQRRRYGRPDYRMLDPKIKSGKISYDGPYSDKKKIYLFAASVATLGTISGAAVMAAAPAATGAATSGGAGAYLAGGTAVVAGSAATAEIAMKPDTQKGNYTLRAESHQEDAH